MTAMRATMAIWLGTLGSVLTAAGGRAADWPQFGGTASRNMVSDEKGLPDLRPAPGETSTALTSTSPYVKWTARVGATTWGNPTVSGGRVFVGTAGGGGLVKCFDCATGKLLWQLVSPPRKFATPERPQKYGKLSNWDYLVTTQAQTVWGICSSLTVDGHRAYILTQRGEVVCLDVNGLADGNQGPFTDEAKYKSDDDGRPVPLEATDADILWTWDLWTDVMTRPADTFSNSVLVDGNLLYLSTCNGIERYHQWYGKPAQPPNPAAPNLVVLDKRSGRLVATDGETIGTRMLHGQWSSPSLGEVNGKRLIFYGGGDGVCYAFEALSGVPRSPVKLKKVWSYDCNPPEYKGIGVENYSLGDKDILTNGLPGRDEVARQQRQHIDRAGRLLSMSEIIGSPVFHGSRVYVAIGRDPRHGPGRGALHCIDATRTGDITKSGRIWCYQEIDRSLSTVSVAGGLVYAADVAGRLHCLDTDTGRCYWTHDRGEETWGSTLVADGKVYLITRKSFLVLATGKEKKVLATVRMGGECSPIAADGVLYVVLRGTLYALHQGKAQATSAP
jgi:outer membrane protein assembly factor BamB